MNDHIQRTAFIFRGDADSHFQLSGAFCPEVNFAERDQGAILKSPDMFSALRYFTVGKRGDVLHSEPCPAISLCRLIRDLFHKT